MKKIVTLVLLVLPLAISSCASRGADAASSVPGEYQSGPIVETTQPEDGVAPEGPGSSNGGAAATIVLDDNGKTFTYTVGASFLLNLGADIYNWEVTVDQQDAISLKMGVTVVDGAQGTFEALQPGTALLTAVGDPKCRQSNPPCGMPTVLFKVTIIVQ